MTKLDRIKRYLEHVLALDKAATKGPWHCIAIGDQGAILVGPESMKGGCDEHTGEGYVCELPGTWFDKQVQGENGINCINDAAYIAESRLFSPAAARALLDVIEFAQIMGVETVARIERAFPDGLLEDV